MIFVILIVSIVINVSRGRILDEFTLITLLKERKIGGAGLDVLNSYSPKYVKQIWQTPNLIITPHVSAHCPEYTKLLEAFFEQQFSRYIKNGKLENLIDLSKS